MVRADKILFMMVFVVTQVVAPSLLAQEKSATKKTGAPKRQALDFEDELIQGDVAQPEIMSILQREDFNFKRLIRLRKDFLPEMRKSAFELQKSGGKSK
jgi:hypothetical protein